MRGQWDGRPSPDLIFLAGAPIVVLLWEQRPFGNYPAVTVTLDSKYLHKTDLPDAEYLYELPIEDPRSGAAFGSNIGSERLQMTEQSSELMPDDVQQAFLDAITSTPIGSMAGPSTQLVSEGSKKSRSAEFAILY